MKFGLLAEATVNKGMSYGVRLREALDECIFSEEMGFDFVGTSEQHFMESAYSISAPEVFMGALAARTSVIKLRHMAVVSLGFNNPVRVAERLATLDILSRGRMEWSTARSNNHVYLDAFGIDPSKTRAEWREHTEATMRALFQTGEVKFRGDFYNFRLPNGITPKFENKKTPPIYVTATSKETHYNAGRLGLGVMQADDFLGWEYQKELIENYRKGIAEAQPIDGLYAPTDKVCNLAFAAYCAETRDEAFKVAGNQVRGLLDSVKHMAQGLADTKSPDYQYKAEFVKKLDKHGNDLPYMANSTSMMMVGTPDDFIERLKVLESIGVDEIVLKFDGYGHSKTKKAIELVGKYVIPTFAATSASIPPNHWESHGVAVNKFET